MTRRGLLIVLTLYIAGTASCVGRASYDVVLYGGIVVDGTGAPPRVADIGIVGDRIAYVDTRRLRNATDQIDASGLVLVPGFLEVHGHLEPRDQWHERARAWLRQGVTLVALGAEGTIEPAGVARVAEELTTGGSPASFSLYSGVGGLEAASEAITGALESGALGVAHHPGAGVADVALIDELRRSAARAGVLLAENIFNPIEEELAYDGGTTTTLESILVVPDSARAGPRFDLDDALRNRVARARIRSATEATPGSWLSSFGYASVRITSSADHPELVGASLVDIARENRRTPFDQIAWLLTNADRPVGIAFTEQGNRPVRDLPTGEWDDPRPAGLFARVLDQYVKELQLTSLEEAVRRMSALPAERIGLDDRGRLEPGMVADVVAFDLESIRDHASWAEPHLPAEGVVHSVVNGVPVIRDGQITGRLPGRFVTRGS